MDRVGQSMAIALIARATFHGMGASHGTSQRCSSPTLAQVVLLQKHLARALHSSQLTGVRRAGSGELPSLACLLRGAHTIAEQQGRCLPLANAGCMVRQACIHSPLPCPACSRRSCCVALRSVAPMCTSCSCTETPSGRCPSGCAWTLCVCWAGHELATT